ncbi:MAG: hypothetical protein LLF94_05960 [Chlamydiales bacterium]|nr:hypothetical protein [Chlamydiales bacterium]
MTIDRSQPSSGAPVPITEAEKKEIKQIDEKMKALSQQMQQIKSSKGGYDLRSKGPQMQILHDEMDKLSAARQKITKK